MKKAQSIFEALNIERTEARLLLYRSEVLMHIQEWAKEHAKNYKSLAISGMCSSSFARKITNGEVDQTPLEALLSVAINIGLEVSVSIEKETSR